MNPRPHSTIQHNQRQRNIVGAESLSRLGLMPFNMLFVAIGQHFLRPGSTMLTLADTVALAHFWIYRLGSYMLFNVVDDPALLALVFC